MTDSGFTRPALPGLINRISADLQARFNTDDLLRRQDQAVYARVMAATVNALYGHLDYLARNMLPDLADEDWLYRHSAMKKVVRKEPREALGYVRWEGVENNITVPVNAIIQRGDRREFITIESATSSNRTLRVRVRAVEPGLDSNTDDGEPMTLASPVNGLPSTGSADTIYGADDLENLEEWRLRIMDRWYWIPQGGADADYEIWALEVNGISRAWTKRTWQGAGTVGVMLATNDPDHPTPSPEVIEETRQHIAPLAPVAGSGLFVFGVDERAIDMEILLRPDSDAVRAAVTAELKSSLYRDGIPGGKIYPSRLSEAISIATGEFAHALITPADDVQLGETELPLLGEITWRTATNSSEIMKR
jgi:uncharacterized phage protein gp47/JayE